MAKRGRPTDFKPEYAQQAEKLCHLGATDTELADFFNVTDRTIYRWQIQHPEFCQALKSGKDAADERIERSLFHRAAGYTFDSEKVFQFQGEIVRAQTREHVPPDTTACIFWLKNRRKEKWRDRHEHEIGNPGDFDRMTDDELREHLASEARTLLGGGSGTEKAGDKIAPRSPGRLN